MERKVSGRNIDLAKTIWATPLPLFQQASTTPRATASSRLIRSIPKSSNKVFKHGESGPLCHRTMISQNTGRRVSIEQHQPVTVDTVDHSTLTVPIEVESEGTQTETDEENQPPAPGFEPPSTEKETTDRATSPITLSSEKPLFEELEQITGHIIIQKFITRSQEEFQQLIKIRFPGMRVKEMATTHSVSRSVSSIPHPPSTNFQEQNDTNNKDQVPTDDPETLDSRPIASDITKFEQTTNEQPSNDLEDELVATSLSSTVETVLDGHIGEKVVANTSAEEDVGAESESENDGSLAEIKEVILSPFSVKKLGNVLPKRFEMLADVDVHRQAEADTDDEPTENEMIKNEDQSDIPESKVAQKATNQRQSQELTTGNQSESQKLNSGNQSDAITGLKSLSVEAEGQDIIVLDVSMIDAPSDSVLVSKTEVEENVNLNATQVTKKDTRKMEEVPEVEEQFGILGSIDAQIKIASVPAHEETEFPKIAQQIETQVEKITEERTLLFNVNNDNIAQQNGDINGTQASESPIAANKIGENEIHQGRIGENEIHHKRIGEDEIDAGGIDENTIHAMKIGENGISAQTIAAIIPDDRGIWEEEEVELIGDDGEMDFEDLEGKIISPVFIDQTQRVKVTETVSDTETAELCHETEATTEKSYPGEVTPDGYASEDVTTSNPRSVATQTEARSALRFRRCCHRRRHAESIESSANSSTSTEPGVLDLQLRVQKLDVRLRVGGVKIKNTKNRTGQLPTPSAAGSAVGSEHQLDILQVQGTKIKFKKDPKSNEQN